MIDDFLKRMQAILNRRVASVCRNSIKIRSLGALPGSAGKQTLYTETKLPGHKNRFKDIAIVDKAKRVGEVHFRPYNNKQNERVNKANPL
jgi:hypothetical protein